MKTIRSTRRATMPVALVIGALAVTGCAGGAPTATDEGDASDTLTVWFPGSSQPEIELVTETLVPQFEEATGIDVEVTFVDWGDLAPKLNSAFAAGTAPDVFGHGPAAAADLAANDRVMSLDDFVAEMPQEEQADLSAALTGGQVDGTQYLMPLSISGQLIAYRADLLAEAGVDPEGIASWDDLHTAAEALTVREGDRITRAGVLLGTAAIQRSLTFNALISAAGGELMSADGSTAEFAGPEGVEALTYFTDLYNGKDAVADNLGNDYLNSAPAEQPLTTGAAAMTLLTSQAVSQIVAANPDLEIGVLPALEFSQPAAFGGAGAGLFINADTAEPDAAWDFIEFMTSSEISTAYAEGTGTIPIRASAADSDYVQSSPVVQAFLGQVGNFVPNPNVVSWTQIRDVLDTYLEQALAGVATPQEALDGAAEQVAGIVG